MAWICCDFIFMSVVDFSGFFSMVTEKDFSLKSGF